jgi:transposase
MATTTIKAHKIRLNPTSEQENYLRRACGTRRFVYNGGLAEWNKQYQEYKEGKREKKPNANELKKLFQAIREPEEAETSLSPVQPETVRSTDKTRQQESRETQEQICPSPRQDGPYSRGCPSQAHDRDYTNV